MTTGNLRKLAALASRHKPSAVSHKPGEEKSEAALRKLSEKIGAAPRGRRGQQSWLAIQVRPAAEQLLCATRRCRLV